MLVGIVLVNVVERGCSAGSCRGLRRAVEAAGMAVDAGGAIVDGKSVDLCAFG